MSCQTSTVALHSIGCRTNQQEMLALEAELVRSGYEVVERPELARLVVVNTCCVTGVAESKTRRVLRALARRAPQARFLVTGCLAQHSPGQLAAMKQVDWVVPNSRKHEIAAILAGSPATITAAPVGTPVPGTFPVDAHYRALARTRFFVKIQEGCSHRCTYCIVPTVRGPSRSVPVAQILNACAQAGDGGAREIVLTGTHIGQYRDTGLDLAGLVHRLLSLRADWRVRLSSLDPRELSEPLLALIAEHPRVCEQLHLSVQSLAPEVLDAMGRGSGAKRLDALIQCVTTLRAQAPRVALGADFIVGFPSETRADFDLTCERVRAAGFTSGHVFRFSQRPGTAAAAMSDGVGDRERKRRSAALIALLDEQHMAFVRSREGQVEQILIEQCEPCRGLSGNYLRVGFRNEGLEPNRLVAARIGPLTNEKRLDCWATLLDTKGVPRVDTQSDSPDDRG